MFQVNPLKNQALFSSKDKSKTLKCHLLQFLFGVLRVKQIYIVEVQWLVYHGYFEHVIESLTKNPTAADMYLG